YRISKGLAPLLWDQSAQVIAETRAIEGGKFHTEFTHEFAHTRPNGDSMDGFETGIIAEWKNLKTLTGKNFNPFCWENAARGTAYRYDDFGNVVGLGPRELIDGWINSPGHEAALTATSPANVTRYGAVAMSHFDTDIITDAFGGVTPINFWYYNSIEVYN
ncbi:hypothetical protein AALA61_15735, partial [Oscillospiraceae bacterium 42-9]